MGERTAAGDIVHFLKLAATAAAAAMISGAAAAQPGPAPNRPGTRAAGRPSFPGANPAEFSASLDLGPNLERGRSARAELAEHRRLTAALAALAPQRKGVVDAYVVVVGLDSDPVFGREAREAAKVLSRRFDSAGRTLVLAGGDGRGPGALPMGSLHALNLALARIAELVERGGGRAGPLFDRPWRALRNDLS